MQEKTLALAIVLGVLVSGCLNVQPQPQQQGAAETKDYSNHCEGHEIPQWVEYADNYCSTDVGAVGCEDGASCISTVTPAGTRVCECRTLGVANECSGEVPEGLYDDEAKAWCEEKGKGECANRCTAEWAPPTNTWTHPNGFWYCTCFGGI